MGRRGVLSFILVFIAVFCAYGVYADHTASVSITPTQIYETNTGIFQLTISNTKDAPFFGFVILADNSSSSIQVVSIAYTDFTLLASTIPSDWTRSLANDVLLYANGKISSNASQPFFILAKADNVDADTNAIWTITTKDLNNDTVDNNVQIMIINDTTPPVLSDSFPYDGMFVKEGTNDQEVRINAYDNETGMKETKFNYDDCAWLNDTKHIVLANTTPDLYESILDLSAYGDSTRVCFSFNSENNGGAIAVIPGQLIIDGLAPIVTLISPANDVLMNSQSDFQFIATDNLAPNMTCDLLVDGDVETTVTALNNVTATISVQNVSEGRHEWAVRCTDLAGWDNVSETRRYILDRTAPEALLTSPPRLVMKSGVTLNFAVTDNFGLDGVTYSYSNFSVDNPNYEYVNLTLNKSSYASVNETQFAIETVLWEEGDHDITIWADDIASNNGTGFYFITIDNTAPLINLLSPLNESVTDATFVFNTSDNTDDAVECTLYVNETARGSSSVNNSITPNGTIRASLIQGTYQWRVECIDDAGNNGASETWNITIIDLTGPEITFNDVGTVIRGNDIIVNATISDISGVDESSVQASIEDANNITSNITLQRVTGTDSYVGVYPTNSTFPLGTYIARVSAEDVFGNQNSNYSDYGLTYGYVVNLILNPNPAQTGQQVTASGTVSYDNGEIANDGFITLMLPDTSIDVVIENGGFSHMFNAPGVAALYGVIATITPENGFTFSAAGMLNVTNETQAENTTTTTTTTTSSNNGGSGSTSDFGRCGVNKVEDENGRCVDITESDTPTEIVSLPEQSQGDENSNSGVVTFGSCGDGSCDQNENPHNCALDCGEPEKTAGVGKAGGFLNLSSINSSLLWLMLVLLIVAFVLLYLYQYGAPEPSMPSISAPKMPKFSLFKKKDHLGIDKYMENRNKP